MLTSGWLPGLAARVAIKAVGLSHSSEAQPVLVRAAAVLRQEPLEG